MYVVARLDHKRVLKIERTKAFQRFVERRKLSMELWQYRGFLRKAVSLGRVAVRLEDLLTRAEITGSFDVRICPSIVFYIILF